jgi:hypothetical protein
LEVKVLRFDGCAGYAQPIHTHPGNVAKARKKPRKGLDPNKWFNNVELVIAEQIGTQTTTYVRNIFNKFDMPGKTNAVSGKVSNGTV